MAELLDHDPARTERVRRTSSPLQSFARQPHTNASVVPRHEFDPRSVQNAVDLSHRALVGYGDPTLVVDENAAPHTDQRCERSLREAEEGTGCTDLLGAHRFP